MANSPKKITDPTEAALSAIQEALSARDPAREPEPYSLPPDDAAEPHAPLSEPIPEPQTLEATEPSWHAMRADVPLGEDPLQEPSALRRPANDDRESIG